MTTNTLATHLVDGLMPKKDKARSDGRLPHQLPVYTVAEANALTTKKSGMLIVVSDGNAGARCLAEYDGTNWKVVALGATIAAS